MTEKARWSPRWALRKIARSGWGSGTRPRGASIAALSGRGCTCDEQAPARHLRGCGDAEKAKAGRYEVGERAAFREHRSVERDDERDRVRRVCRVRARAVVFEHLLGVAVVGRDEADAAKALDGRDDAAEAGVHGFYRSHDGRDDARVTD